jgi:DNA-binding transcriptional LysR family regulator
MLNEIDLSRADLNLLCLFEVVLAERHIGRAAEKLNLTPSAVSHGVGRLRLLLHDPLFLRTPKGVVPTARAMELSAPIADVLARVRGVLSTAEPFDPVRAARRFTIGAPDGVSAVILDSLLAKLRQQGPRIDISVCQLLPAQGETSPERVWRMALADLESRAMDLAIIPSDDIPPRFERRCVYEESFVVAVRKGHPFARNPTLEHYCQMQHLVVSESGDPYGFVDQLLAKQGRSRRIALTVPNFMFALAVLAGSDFVGALPARFVEMHAARFGILSMDGPLPLPHFRLNAVSSKAAMMDAGVAWMFDLIVGAGHAAPRSRGRSRSRVRHR